MVMFTLPTALFARDYENYADCTQDNGTKFCDGYFAGKTKDTTKVETKTDDSVKAADAKKTDNDAESAKNDTNKTNAEKTETATQEPDFYAFFGGNLGLGAVSYKDKDASDYMPTAFLKLGLEFGFKFNVDKDYALGLTGDMEFLTPSEVNPSYVRALGVDSITVGFDMYGFYFDNYFKTDEDETIVFGLGAADIYETVTATDDGKTKELESTDGESVFLIKMGAIYNLSETVDLTVMGKFGFPDDKTGLSMITMLDLGIRLKF